MPRYLTPAKLCLLGLTDLYTCGEIALASRLGVLSLVFRSLHPPTDLDQDGFNPRIALSTTSIDELLLVLGRWQAVQPGRNIKDAFLELIWTWDGPDAIHRFFDHLNYTVARPLSAKPSRGSPLGLFIRRSHLEFTRLQFSDVHGLWTAFVKYRAPSFHHLPPRTQTDVEQARSDQPLWAQLRDSPTTDLQDGSTELGDDDADALVRFSVHRLQRLGGRIPADVLANLEVWVTNTRETDARSLKHFMYFFHHWRLGQYTMAQESLQRYFDFSLVKQPGSETRGCYQYALLHKSVLAADFEKWEDSIDAMEECIATARENQDAACLNYALSWLMFFRQFYPRNQHGPFGNLAKLLGGGDRQTDEIAFLKSKAKDGEHWFLLGGALLEEAKMHSRSGGSTAKCLESITQAAYLCSRHNLLTLMPAVALFQATMYERLGLSHLALRKYESIPVVHSRYVSHSDLSRATCRLAILLSQAGEYEWGLKVLDDSFGEVGGILKLRQRHEVCRGLVLLQRHINRDNHRAVEQITHQLQSARTPGDPELGFELELLSLRWKELTATSSIAFADVLEAIDRLQRSHGCSDVAQQAHLLVLQHRARNCNKPSGSAISLVLQAARIAADSMLVPVLVEALLALGSCLIGLEEYETAKHLLQSILPLALGTTNLRLIADCYLSLGDAYVGAAQFQLPDVAPSLRKADGIFKRSRQASARQECFFGQQASLVREHRIAFASGDEAAALRLSQLFERLDLEKATREGEAGRDRSDGAQASGWDEAGRDHSDGAQASG